MSTTPASPRGRHARRVPSFDGLSQDLRYAVRTLRATPSFAALAVLILALCIGANTAVFSLVSSVLLKPLPFVEPDRLVLLWEDFTALGGPDRVQATPATYVEWKARSRSFEAMSMLIADSYNLTGNGDPERLSVVRAEANLFSVLGLQPLLGRTFLPDDEGPSALPVVVIGEDLWVRRFGADPDIVGKTIALDGLERTVIGVVPPHFRYPDARAAVWVPARYGPEELANRIAYNYEVVARLAPGVGLAAARAEMNAIAAAIAADGNAGPGRASVSPLQEHLSRETRPALYVLLAAAGAILLIGCANVASLLLARAAQRQRELTIRKAVGAGSVRIARQLLTESAVLGACGIAFGVVLSTLSFGYLARLVPATFPDGAALGLDWRVLGFATVITLVTVLLFGAGPAIATARRDFAETLKKGVGGNAGPRAGRMRNALVVAEVTFTVVLLAAAGLLLRSYAAVLAVDPGFPPDRLLVVETPLSESKYRAHADRMDFYRRVLERVRAIGAVESAGYVNLPPLVFKGGRALVGIEGAPPPPPEQFSRNIVADRVAGAGYLETLGVPLLAGRLFDGRDGADSAFTAVVNRAMAERFWPGTDAVGRRFKLGPAAGEAPWITVIGVVGDVRQMGLDTAPEPEFFVSADQPVFDAGFFWPRYLLLRTRGDPLAVAADVRRAIWDVDTAQPVSTIRSMQDVLDSELTSRDTQLTLVGAFAVLALLLASVGLYGVLSYTVAQRTAEIGLRIALGAQTHDVVRGVLRSALGLAAAGTALGIAGAFGVMRLLGSFLFGVSPMDPVTLASVAALLVAVTVIASSIPARRAARIDPLAALRSE